MATADQAANIGADHFTLIQLGQRQVGMVLARNPDHLVGADAAFIMNRSLPAREAPEGYLETSPELIVEIRSKNDTTAEIKDPSPIICDMACNSFGL